MKHGIRGIDYHLFVDRMIFVKKIYSEDSTHKLGQHSKVIGEKVEGEGLCGAKIRDFPIRFLAFQ